MLAKIRPSAIRKVVYPAKNRDGMEEKTKKALYLQRKEIRYGMKNSYPYPEPAGSNRCGMMMDMWMCNRFSRV